jgi:lipopolysaccharide transport system permease protein
LIQPLVTTLTFVVIFGNIAGLSTDGQPKFLFYMSGTIIWSYFASCFVQTANTFVANAGLFGKVYFPRLTVPAATVISQLITLGIQFTQFAVIAAIYGGGGAGASPTAWIVLTPVLIAITAMLAAGLGLAVSSLTTRYRDLQYVVSFGTPLLMYATPIIYPLSAVPERYWWLVALNPMTPVVEAFRLGVLGAGSVTPWHLLYAAGVAAATLLGGIAMFNRTERTFMDTV